MGWTPGRVPTSSVGHNPCPRQAFVLRGKHRATPEYRSALRLRHRRRAKEGTAETAETGRSTEITRVCVLRGLGGFFSDSPARRNDVYFPSTLKASNTLPAVPKPRYAYPEFMNTVP